MDEGGFLQVSEYDSFTEIWAENFFRIVYEFSVPEFPAEFEPENDLVESHVNQETDAGWKTEHGADWVCPFIIGVNVEESEIEHWGEAEDIEGEVDGHKSTVSSEERQPTPPVSPNLLLLFLYVPCLCL